MNWRRELGPLVEPVVGVAPEPGFTGLVALDERVLGGLRMRGGVLRGGGVTAADVAAFGAAAEVEPPAAGGVAFHATIPARRHRWVDSGGLRHAGAPLRCPRRVWGCRPARAGSMAGSPGTGC